MKLGALTGKVIVLLALLATVGLSILGYRTFEANLRSLDRSSQEPIGWSAVQLEIELQKFDKALADLQIGRPGASGSSVNSRFDILWSRVAVFRLGPVGERLSSYDQEKMIVAALFEEMQHEEPRIVALSDDDRALAGELRETFSVFATEIRLLSRRVFIGEVTKAVALRSDLRSGAYLAVFASAAFAIIAIAALFYINYESVRYRTLAAKNKKLAEAADAASLAKSRFLTMMSHELRTPMNGVLGTLSLVRQSGLGETQGRLVDRAERSGRQMIGMLSDILDFSALQDDRLELERKPFETKALVDAIEELFDPVANREGISFEVASDPDCPIWMAGDFRRIRQTISHLTAYVVETAGTKNVDVRLSCAKDMLSTTISFDYSAIGGEWHPNLVLGDADAEAGQFASDALGPAVARGLIERMGGAIRIDTPNGDRIAIIIDVAVEHLHLSQLNIRLEVTSAALEAICKAALGREDVNFVDDGFDGQVHTVLTDCNQPDEVAHVTALKMAYPNALLIAIGQPTHPDLYDTKISMPVDVKVLHDSVVSRLA